MLKVYVDDIVVTGNDEEGKNKLRECLISEFEIKELGRLKYFLGIEVVHSKEGNLYLLAEIYCGSPN